MALRYETGVAILHYSLPEFIKPLVIIRVLNDALTLIRRVVFKIKIRWGRKSKTKKILCVGGYFTTGLYYSRLKIPVKNKYPILSYVLKREKVKLAVVLKAVSGPSFVSGNTKQSQLPRLL